MGKKHKPEEILGKQREVKIVWRRAGRCRMPADGWGYRADPLPLAQRVWCAAGGSGA